MTKLPHDAQELQEIYQRRFDLHLAYRHRVWRVLTAKLFSRYIPADGVVVDLGCGYGQFINNVVCQQKYGMDLNPAAARYLHSGVTFLEQDCAQPWQLPDNSLDVVFTSNFFEHLPSKEMLSATLAQAWRCLRPGGRIIALGPNIRYVGGAYWDFWDHHLALSERSLQEALEVQKFQVELVVPQFLPYTMVNRRAFPMIFVSLYLMLPPAWKIWGKQFLVIGRKPVA